MNFLISVSQINSNLGFRSTETTALRITRVENHGFKGSKRTSENSTCSLRRLRRLRSHYLLQLVTSPFSCYHGRYVSASMHTSHCRYPIPDLFFYKLHVSLPCGQPAEIVPEAINCLDLSKTCQTIRRCLLPFSLRLSK